MEIDEVIRKLRSQENTLLVNMIFGFMFASGFMFGIVLYANGQSFYYLFSLIPYLLIMLTIVTLGPPYPLNIDENIFSIFINEDLMYTDISQFSISCLSIAPFAIISIIFITEKSQILVLSFQILSHLLIILSFLFFTLVYFKPIPIDE